MWDNFLLFVYVIYQEKKQKQLCRQKANEQPFTYMCVNYTVNQMYYVLKT